MFGKIKTIRMMTLTAITRLPTVEPEARAEEASQTREWCLIIRKSLPYLQIIRICIYLRNTNQTIRSRRYTLTK
jgi:hypothetical protein